MGDITCPRCGYGTHINGEKTPEFCGACGERLVIVLFEGTISAFPSGSA